MKPLMPVKPLNESEVNQLLSGEITVKKARALREKISERANYIVRRMCAIENIDLGWWDFANEAKQDGGDPVPGYFDEEEYGKFIQITGEEQNKGYLELESFPTRWLWEDFEKEMINQKAEKQKVKEVKSVKSKEAAKKRKQAKQQLIDSALSKLTEQERKALKLKVKAS